MASAKRIARSRLCGATRSATQASRSPGSGSALALGTTTATGTSPATATDWVWARAQPSAFAHLVTDRGWSPRDYADRAVPSILAEVVSPGS